MTLCPSLLFNKLLRYDVLFHPRFIVPIPSALYHTAVNRVGISLISTSFSRRVILYEMRVILYEMRVISWK